MIAGRSFVIIGLNTFTVKSFIEDRGGILKDNISSTTSAIITHNINISNRRINWAKKYNIPIYTSDVFMKSDTNRGFSKELLN